MYHNLIAAEPPPDPGGGAGIPIGRISGVGILGAPQDSLVNQLILLETIISNVTGALTILAGIWFTLQVILAAISWISAGGDKNLIETARKKLINALIGIFIVAVSFVLISVVGRFLGIPNILDVANLILGVGL